MSNDETANRDLTDDKVVDRESLKRIIEIQDVPEEVAIKFLKAKGSLSSTNFGKQYLNEHQ
jgi:hypothetical protein